MNRAILRTLMPGFEGLELPEWVERRLASGMGGVCLFGENVASHGQVRALCAQIYAANPNAVIAIDEEGGDATRLYYDRGSPFPGNAVLGRLNDLDLTRRVGEQVGWELRDVGVGLTFGPVADVNSNKDNPVIGVRSFGADAQAAAQHVAAWVHGVQSIGVAACAKHFPGHGDTAQDSHVSLPTIDASAGELRGRELVPFRAAIDAAVQTIMTTHILLRAFDPDRPATLSAPILQTLLRGELGFAGLIVSDALDMVGASGKTGIPVAAGRALAAGCDMLCIGTKNTDQQIGEIVAGVEAALASRELSGERLAEAAARVDALGSWLHTFRKGIPPSPTYAPGAVPGLDAATVAQAFEVSDHGRAFLDAPGDLFWICLSPTFNYVIGYAPWGPFVEGGATAGATVSLENPVSAQDLAAIEIPTGARVVVVGKEFHRQPHAPGAIAALRGRAPGLIVVDMGWPDPDFTGIDIATFGASRVVGDALLRMLG